MASNILFVSSSLSGENSKSRQVASGLVANLRSVLGGTVTERHLTPANMPHVDMATLAAAGTPEAARTPEQAAQARLADQIVVEAETAETIVIAAPMYNFGVPSALKAWLDHLARAGRTFRYTASGPEGLLKNKRVYVVVSRGGFYGAGSPLESMEFQDSYLRVMLGFLGMDDVTVIAVESQNLGADAAAKGLAQAQSDAAALVPLAA